MKLSTFIHKTGFSVLLFTIFSIPLYFLPITAEFYDYNKMLLLFATAIITFILWMGGLVAEKQFRSVRSPFGFAVFATMITWLLSTFMRTPNRLDAFFNPMQTGTILALGLIFFTGINLIKSRRELDLSLGALIVSFVFLGLINLVWATGLLASVVPDFYKSTVWSPAGSSLGAVISMLTVAVFVLVLAVKDRKEKSKMPFLVGSLLVLVISSSALIFRMYTTPANKPVFLNQQVSWAIALEAMKTSPLLGTGPDTYLQIFTRFKPASYNLSETWAVRFSSASNYYLQLLSTVGILGLVAYALIGIKSATTLVSLIRQSSDSPLHSTATAIFTATTLAFVSQLFLPASIVWSSTIFFLLIIGTAVLKNMGSDMAQDANVDIVATSQSGHKAPILPWIGLVLSILLAVPTVWFASRNFMGEYHFRNALSSASANKARDTYDSLINAIRWNRYKDAYRVAYSQTNWLLANAAANQGNLTAEQRNTVTQLIQQSIREAQNAVALNPNKVSNVENLSSIYRNLLAANVANNADRWSVAALNRAIQLDPFNPALRIDLGGIFFSTKNYDEAIRQFESAVNLKGDYANAYYNLALALKEKSDFQRAYNAMSRALSLITDKSSADYEKVQKELEDLSTKVGKANESSAKPADTTLTTPKAIPSPKISPIPLDESFGPDTTSTPSPSPRPTNTQTPSPTPQP